MRYFATAFALVLGPFDQKEFERCKAMKPTQEEPKESLELYAAVGRALSAWSQVEHQLCSIFSRTLIEDPNAAVGAAWSAFYAIDSFWGKLNMVGSAVQIRWHDQSTILASWEKIYKRAREKNNMRNELAHGCVINFGKPELTFYVPAFHKGLIAGIPNLLASLSEGAINFALPANRLSAQQINHRTQAFNLFRQRLARFDEALHALITKSKDGQGGDEVNATGVGGAEDQGGVRHF
jgi:hypothetical protein